MKHTLKDAWNFIWKGDSLLSWICSLAIAFIVVKFIFFPLLSLAFGTPLPLVVVESSSMHHPGGFIGNAIGLEDSFEFWWEQKGSWYNSRGIEKADASTWPLKTGLEMGDIVIVSGHDKEIEVGDIIIFNANKKYPLIHRVVGIKKQGDEIYYETKGDNNSGQLKIEKNISEDAVVGKAIFRIPKFGWIKLGLVKILERIP